MFQEYFLKDSAILTTPSAPFRNGFFFFVAQPPLPFKEGTGDWPFVRGLENSPPRLGGVPRAINSSLESERRGGRSTSRSYLIESPRSEPNKKGGLRQHL